MRRILRYRRAVVPDAINPSSIRRVLVTKLRHHGDVLLASPVLQVLANRIPHAEIDALVYADTRDMIEGHPALSRLHVVDRGWKRGSNASWPATIVYSQPVLTRMITPASCWNLRTHCELTPHQHSQWRWQRQHH